MQCYWRVCHRQTAGQERKYVCMFPGLNIYMIMTHKYGILFIPLVIDGELAMVVV